MMIKKVIVKKLYSDQDFEKNSGNNFGKKHYKKIYLEKDGDIDCFWKDSKGNEHILFKVRRQVIPEDMGNLIFKFFNEKVNINKKGKSKFISKGENTKTESNYKNIYSFRSNRSKITGFYDKSAFKDISKFGTTTVCRKTAFTRDHFDKWKSTIPFFELIGKYYKELAPQHYKKQLALFKKCPPGFQIE